LLFQGGDLQDALRAAALAGVTAYGFQEFVNPILQQGAYDQAFAAADAANMANAGLDANTIAANLQTYVDPATATSLANSAATQAGSLSYANQLVAQGFTPTEIATALTDLGVSNTVAQSAASAAADGITQIAAQDLVSNITYQPQVRNPIQASPGAIEVTGTAIQPGLLATAAPSLAGAAGGLLGTQVPAQQAPAVVAQTVPVTSSAAPVELQSIAPAAVGGALTQTVPVQATTAPTGTQVAAPVAAATGGLLAPTQTTTVQSTPQQLTPDEASSIVSALSGQPVSVAGQQVQVAGQTSQQISPDNAAALISAATGQQVTVAGQTTGQQSNTSGAEVAGLLATPSTPPASERVTVEDRPIRREEAQILTPVAAGTVAGVPVADVTVPRSSTGPIEGSTTIDPLVALGLLGLAGTALGGGGSTGAPVDQAAYDAIARGRSPVYPRGEFTPISLGGLPGMGGISDGMLGAYDYFGPYYGAGRFGARPQAFALPGLLGPQMMSIPTTPSRSAAV
jgi:hypothetical protein